MSRALTVGARRAEGEPTHPVWKANLVMAGVVIVLLVLSVLSGIGDR